MFQTFTIYGLIDPRTNVVRYVGKTQKTLKSRLNQHQPCRCRRGRWLKELMLADLNPVIVPLETDVPPELSDDRERAWIRKFVEYGVDLTNHHDHPMRTTPNKPSTYQLAARKPKPERGRGRPRKFDQGLEQMKIYLQPDVRRQFLEDFAALGMTSASDVVRRLFQGFHRLSPDEQRKLLGVS